MSDCIFCKIAADEFPSHKLYEDEYTIAFLDIYPAVEGYALVIPKKHTEFVWDMDNESYSKLMSTIKIVGEKLREVYQPKNVGVHIEGLDMPHTHVKVFPFTSGTDFRALADRSKEPDHDNLSEVAKTLKIN